MSIPEKPLFSSLDRANPHARNLHPYVPGKQPTGEGWTKLNTNELPYPPSPRVASAVAAEVARLSKYPSPTSADLRAAVADYHNVEPSQVIIGNGSDELLTLLVRAFAGPERRVGETKPSYSLYPVLASIQNTTVESIDLPNDFSLPVDEIHRCSAPVFFLTTPNAPFGVGYSIDEMKEAINGFKGVFVADEAYVDFGDSSAVTLLGECPNLIVTRTFSKSYGLAGLRVGYAVGSAESIDLLDRFRDSYNVNRLSQAGALAALKDTVYHADVVDKVRATRERFSTSLRDLGWEVIPSQANFVFARPQPVEGKHQTELAADAFTWLESHKVLVRYFPNSPMTSTGLRITIGTDEEMSRCLDELKAWQAAL